jgi:hypothetical protein
MNDYVTKPFEENILIAVLQKALNIATVASDQITELASSPTENEPLYDISKITQLSKGNPQFIKKMIDLFVEHTPPAIAHLSPRRAGATAVKTWRICTSLPGMLAPSGRIVVSKRGKPFAEFSAL